MQYGPSRITYTERRGDGSADPLSLTRTKGSARVARSGRRQTVRAYAYVVDRTGTRTRAHTHAHTRTHTTEARACTYMEAATSWAELRVPGWENRRGSHPQHHRVWFKFVDLVNRIGSARLRCTEFEVFDRFYTEIGFKKYICLICYVLLSHSSFSLRYRAFGIPESRTVFP